MFAKKYIALLLLFFSYILVKSQICSGNGRYLQRIFPQITHTQNIQFATVEALPSVYINETQTVSQNLYLDVFEPTGDTLQKRPLVILAFGGAFLIGTKDDADIQAACDSLAHLGYVTASIQYRLGLNPSNAQSGERAVYRAAQDYSAAVRYFKQFANQYKIDTNAIFVGGASAGGFAAMHMAYGEEDERPASSFGQGGLFPMPDLGCFDCSGNAYNYSHRVRGVLNMWGAIGYLNWIEPNDPPIVSFHGDMDPLVPYNEGYPFTVGATLPYVYGSVKITERMQQVGIYNEFYSYQSAIHQLWGGALQSTWAFGPTEFQVPILNGIRLFLYKQLKPQASVLSGEDSVCSNTSHWYSVPYRNGFRYCWQIQNGQVLQQSANQIQVKWNTTGQGQVSVREFNHLDIPTDSALLKNIHIAPTPDISINGSATHICLGDTLYLTASGADSYTWTPNNSINNPINGQVSAIPTQNTVYTVTGINTEACQASSSFSVSVSPLPIAPIITLIGGQLYVPEQYASYQWYVNGQPIPNATTNVWTVSGGGVYTVEVGQGTGCYATSFPYTIGYATIDEDEKTVPTLFPNPFIENIDVRGLANGMYHINIYAITGEKLFAQEQIVSEHILLLQLSHLTAGTYLLELKDYIGVSYTYRIYKQ